jgi:hypothetical protein
MDVMAVTNRLLLARPGFRITVGGEKSEGQAASKVEVGTYVVRIPDLDEAIQEAKNLFRSQFGWTIKPQTIETVWEKI